MDERMVPATKYSHWTSWKKATRRLHLVIKIIKKLLLGYELQASKAATVALLNIPTEHGIIVQHMPNTCQPKPQAFMLLQVMHNLEPFHIWGA
ncbi:unnamed protein product [Prunus armeniaca]